MRWSPTIQLSAVLRTVAYVREVGVVRTRRWMSGWSSSTVSPWPPNRELSPAAMPVSCQVSQPTAVTGRPVSRRFHWAKASRKALAAA